MSAAWTPTPARPPPLAHRCIQDDHAHQKSPRYECLRCHDTHTPQK
ncbi:hypothetical protein HMPREF1549_00472 [Actinomyces johnsonii F0510]|uniref:Uncharacterized protein n=1 Tax=Actinomyces johnsonii F0510 TaxID=1227262 RepID=U1QIW7_9ACTO|nr:hypothetical protein HMPREF1549_00472 [Actinomyces johnsonii F0510]